MLSILLLLEMFMVVHLTLWQCTGHLAMPHLHHVDEATDPEEAQKSNHEAPQHHQQQEGERPRLAPEEQQQPAQATVCPVPWNLLLTTINDVPKAETGDGRCRLRDQLGGGDRSTIGPRLRLHKDENNIGAGKLFESQRKQAAAQMRLPLLPPLLSSSSSTSSSFAGCSFWLCCEGPHGGVHTKREQHRGGQAF